MNLGDAYNWGLPAGSLFGIRIRLHWLLLGAWLYYLHPLLQDASLSGPEILGYWVLINGIISLMILLHEFGHCYAAHSVGGGANEVLLWPLGGLAMCHAPNVPRAQFIVAAGGPLVTLLLTGVAFGAFQFIEPQGPWWTVRNLLVNFQAFILIFNLIPLYPLDGGRMCHAILWGFLGRRGAPGAYGRATLATVYVSRGCAILGGLYAIFSGSLFLVLLFVWAWMGTEGLYQRLRQGETPDDTFGYDFSRGYTSLEGPQRRRRQSRLANWWRGRKERAAARRQPSIEDKQRVDALLDKISREGMPSLTREERRFLDRMSKRWKQ